MTGQIVCLMNTSCRHNKSFQDTSENLGANLIQSGWFAKEWRYVVEQD